MFTRLCTSAIRYLTPATGLRTGLNARSTLACANIVMQRAITPQTLLNTPNIGSIRQFSLHLNAIADLPDAKHPGTRVGRGRSSGIGKTCGRGIKGRGSRVGHFGKPRHEGGQSALWRRSPKRGFRNNVNRAPLSPVSLQTLVNWVAAGRLDASKTITMKDIYDSGLSGRFEHGIKILAGSNPSAVSRLPMPLHLEVSHCSAPVKEAIEKAGGSVKFTYYSELGLRNLLKPGSLNFEVKPSVPQPKKAIRYELQTVGPAGHEKVIETLHSRIQRKIWKKK